MKYIITMIIYTLYFTLCSWTMGAAHLGNALSFTGKEYIELSKSYAIGSTSHTVELWLKVPTGISGRIGVIMGNYGMSPNSNWEIHDDGELRLYWNGGEIDARGTTDLRDDKWHHVAFVRDVSSDKIIVYIDGEVELSRSTAGSNITLGAFRIGSDRRGSSTLYFHGAMDEFRIWSKARTQQEIKESRRAYLSGEESGLVAYYQFDQGNAGLDNAAQKVLRDFADRSFDGTLVGFDLTGQSSNWVSTSHSALLNTLAISDITSSSASVQGEIEDIGSPYPLQHGFCWNTTGLPTVSGACTQEGFVTAKGTFESELTYLEAHTTYYVRAYAKNENGIVYGDELSFTTAAQEASIITKEVKYITSHSAIVWGEISALGKPTVRQYGVCWNTSGDPSISDSKTEEGPASSKGYFTTKLSMLSPYTSYYVRSYVTNEAGTVYGEEISFRTNIEGWNLNPSSFEQSMTVTGVLQIADSVYDSASEIIIGAFMEDSICVGLSENKYFSKIAKYRVPLMIYGNKNGQMITLKAYVPDKDSIFLLSKAYEFKADLSYGNYLSPETWIINKETSLFENQPNIIHLYPNPASDYLTITTANAVQLYDAGGKLLTVASKSYSGKTELDIRTLNAGLYFVTVDKVAYKVVVY